MAQLHLENFSRAARPDTDPLTSIRVRDVEVSGVNICVQHSTYLGNHICLDIRCESNESTKHWGDNYLPDLDVKVKE